MILEDRGYELPESFVRVILDIISNADDQEVLSFVAKRKDLRGGLKPVDTAVPRFKSFISDYISTTNTLDPELSSFLYDTSLGLKFVAVLSLRAIDHAHLEFRSYFGNEEFLFALLLDERDEVFELGKSLLEEDEDELISREESRDLLLNGFNPFLSRIAQLINEKQGIESKEENLIAKDVKELKQEIKAKVREASSLREIIAGERQARVAAAAEKEQAFRRKEEELERYREKVKSLEQSLFIEKQACHETKTYVKLEVQQRVNEALEKVSSRWLRKALNVEKEFVSSDSFDDLIGQTDQAIQKQTKLDNNCGNRRSLFERLEHCRRLSTEIHTMISNAVNVCPELPEVAHKINSETIKLEKILSINESEGVSDFANSIILQIYKSSDYEEIESLQKLALTLTDHGFPHRDLSVIEDAVSEKLALLMAIEEGSLEALSHASSLRLNKSLEIGEESVVFFDGHNIINGLPVFSAVCQQDHSQGRQFFVDTITRYSSSFPNCEFRIVFDSPVHDREIISETVSVEYSGGGDDSEHRADDYILESISWLVDQNDHRKIYLFSDDKDLGGAAMDSGATILSDNYLETMLTPILNAVGESSVK
jgi:hypothetical protein